jgi:hypothetical protein
MGAAADGCGYDVRWLDVALLGAPPPATDSDPLEECSKRNPARPPTDDDVALPTLGEVAELRLPVVVEDEAARAME